MRIRAAALSALTAGFFLAACAGDSAIDEDDEPAGPPTAETPIGAKADGGELRVRAANMTLWVDVVAEVTREGEVAAITLRGRTSRSLTFAQAWVPDDPFGETTLVGARSFEVMLRGGHEINSVLSGMPLFVALEVASGPHARYDARIDLAPVFREFAGYPEIWVDAFIEPVHVGGFDPLRYRAAVNLGLEDVTVLGGGTPSLVPLGVTRTGIDFSYSDVDQVLIGGEPVGFQSDEGDVKTARLGAAVRAIGLTIEDPREVWSESCDEDVSACVAGAVYGPELAACGSYRQVTRCAPGDLCELMGSTSLSLAEIQLQWGYNRGLDAFVDGCPSGGSWCRFDGIMSYASPECLEAPADLAAVVDQVGALDQALGTGRFPEGQVLDRAGLAATAIFSDTYSPGGPVLFEQIEGLMDGAEVEGWYLVEEVPCPNCTDFQDTIILWYPQQLRVVYLRAGHGFDS